MIAPNMATMLGFIFTNANLPSNVLQKILEIENEKTFNSITVDSDTSTSDTVLLSATRTANHVPINKYSDKRLKDFKRNVSSLMLELAQLIVIDGEGASKFITIKLEGASSTKSAKKIAFSVANSPLVKTAVAGEDPNWGRIAMGIGKSGEIVDQKKLKIKIGNFVVAENGKVSENYDEKKLKEYMEWDSIEIEINLKLGNDAFKCYTCDFTHDYIDINADYRN